MTRGLKSLACLCLAVSSGGCNDDDKNSDGDNALAELAGTWKKSCVKQNENLYESTEWTFSGTNGTAAGTGYLDADCKTAFVAFNVTFSLSGGANRAAPTDSKDIDLTLVKMTTTPKSAETVTARNETHYCGETWELNKAVDMVGKKCGDAEEPVSAGTTGYLIYKIDGNKLYFSASDEAKHNTPETRNVVLDTVPFVKS